MSEVIDLSQARQEREPHLSGAAQCIGCGHKWVAVAPIGTFELECPSCSLEKGRFVAPVLHGDVTWTCNCGNDLFRINRHAQVYCANCAALQEGWF